MAVDADGNAFISGVENSDVEVIRYEPGHGWASAEVIFTLTNEGTGSDLPNPRTSIAMDSCGDAIAVWSKFIAPTEGHTWAKRYEIERGWDDAATLLSSNTISSFKSIQMNQTGDAIVEFVYSTLVSESGQSPNVIRIIEPQVTLVTYKKGRGWTSSLSKSFGQRLDSIVHNWEVTHQTLIDGYGNGIFFTHLTPPDYSEKTSGAYYWSLGTKMLLIY